MVEHKFGVNHSYLYGSGCDLNVVQSPEGAVPVDEVGSSQLMQRLQSDQGAIGAGITSFSSLAQLPLVHENCERLLSCSNNIPHYSIFHLKSFLRLPAGEEA